MFLNFFFFFFCVVLILSLRSEFRVVMSVTISALKRCSVRLYLQLFVGGFMSYLQKHVLICVCLRIVVSNTYCVVFLFVFICLVHPMLPVSLDCPFFYFPFGIL